MTRHCEKCGAEIPEGSPVCRSCFEPVKREGFLSRLLRIFGGVRVSVGKSATGATQVGIIKATDRITIRDGRTGELREYGSLEEVPLEHRQQIRQAREAAISGKNVAPIIVRNAFGKEHTYHSPDEMPPELRALYEKALGNQNCAPEYWQGDVFCYLPKSYLGKLIYRLEAASGRNKMEVKSNTESQTDQPLRQKLQPAGLRLEAGERS